MLFRRWFLPAFFAVLLAVLARVGIFQYLAWPPAGPHQWAQCDRASVARQFAEKSLDIFHPRTLNISNGTGITGMEFPVVNWFVALLYRVFGEHEFLYRGFMLALYFAGMTAAFRLGLYVTGDRFWAALLPVLLFSLSPVICFYAANFIPDMAALSLVLVAWAVFFRTENKTAATYRLLTFLLALATMVKITALIHAVAMTMIALAGQRRDPRKREGGKMAVVLSFAGLLTVAWYGYARWLNETYGGGIFLMDVRPVTGFSQLIEVVRQIYNGVGREYYVRGFSLLLLAANGVLVALRRRLDRRLGQAVVLLYAGSACVFMLMGKQFPEHDYYLLTLLPAIFFNLVAFFAVLQQAIGRTAWRVVLLAGFLVLANYQMVDCRKNMRSRYAIGKWHNYLATASYLGMDRCLDSLGVARDSKILVYPDPSSNISLYFLHREGVVVSEGNIATLERRAKEGRFDFLLIGNPAYLSAAVPGWMIRHPAGQCHTVILYTLHE